MNERIDVLAVMDADIRTFEVLLNMPELGISDPSNALHRSRAARAAVAELIEAANAALNQDQVELPAWLTEQLSDALAKVGAE